MAIQISIPYMVFFHQKVLKCASRDSLFSDTCVHDLYISPFNIPPEKYIYRKLNLMAGWRFLFWFFDSKIDYLHFRTLYFYTDFLLCYQIMIFPCQNLIFHCYEKEKLNSIYLFFNSLRLNC